MSESRMYTIPGGAQSEAKKGLEWRKEHKRGGTPVGVNTARTLAKGGQIGIEKIRHIAKFFPRHEKNKQAKGYKPGQDGFPSNGRIAWALWGGDAAQRWASAIVERENKKEATTAGGGAYGFVDNDYNSDVELDAFRTAHELDPEVGPEFMCRIRLDNSGIDRLYKIEIDGQVYLWDGAAWDNMGHVNGDVYSYDKSLDDPADAAKTTHVIIDPSSAIIISAFLQERPFQPVTLNEIDPEETALMSDGIFGEDFGMIDMVIRAAGEGGLADGDGVDTPDDKAERAKVQPRDAGGLFVKIGSRTVVAKDKARGSGTLESIDYRNGKVNVRLDNGNLISVDPKFTDKEENVKAPLPVSPAQSALPPINMSGILGNPKSTGKPPLATLPGDAEVLPPSGVKDMLSKWTGDLVEARAKLALPPADSSGGSDFDEDGKYVVKKDDSLWSIAEKTKAEGQSTEDQWLKIMAANKDNLQSGDPNLIFPDEKVNIPGREAKPAAPASTTPAKPSAQEAMRKDKQDTSRGDAASRKQQQDTQEKIRQSKQDESRAAKPTAQEAMRQDKQRESRAKIAEQNAEKKTRDAISKDNRRTSEAIDAAKPNVQEAMRQDKKQISTAEAARKSTDAARDAMRDARNTDRADTTARGKAAADQKGRDAVRQDKRATSEAESSATKARAGQEAVRNARNADRLGTTAKAKQATEQKIKTASQQDKKQVSKNIADKATQSATRSAVQSAKKSDSSEVTRKVNQKAQDAVRTNITEAKKQDVPVIKEKQVSNVRKKLAERKEFFREQREKYGTYKERVAASEARQKANKSRGSDK